MPFAIKDGQFADNVILWCVSVTIVAVARQQCIPCALLNYTPLTTIQKYCVLHNSASVVNLCLQQKRNLRVFHVTGEMLRANKKKCLCPWPLDGRFG
jgi:hypothetical protein